MENINSYSREIPSWIHRNTFLGNKLLNMSDIIYTIHDRPGLTYTEKDKSDLVEELRALASLSFNPVPKYQCFADSPNALDDKVIITAHRKGELVGFTSAVMIKIEGLEAPGQAGEVFHCGLAVIHPSFRNQGTLAQFFNRLIHHVYGDRPPTEKLWITSRSRVPNVLVQVATFFAHVFPSPSVLVPDETQLLIARSISHDHREKMLVSSRAVLDETTFVFKGSNDSEDAKGFVKDVNDPRYWHRNIPLNDFYRAFLGNSNDEVLQVSDVVELTWRGLLTCSRWVILIESKLKTTPKSLQKK